MKNKSKGFTLIEVLLALAIVAIALSALLKATAEEIHNTQIIKDKMIKHWIAMQGIAAIQLNLIPLENREATKVTVMLGQRWFWRIRHKASPLPKVEEVTLTFSKRQAGPFSDPWIGYRYSA